MALAIDHGRYGTSRGTGTWANISAKQVNDLAASAATMDSAHAVAHVLMLIARRLELRHKAEMFSEGERRKAVNAFTGKSVAEVAALTMQRSVRQFLHGIKRKQHAARKQQLLKDL